MKARPNVVLAVIVGLVLVLAVLAAVISARRATPAGDPGTPEGTVQLYLFALVEGDDDEVVALLDPDLGCRVPLPDHFMTGGRLQLNFLNTRIRDGRAEVLVEITQYDDTSPFNTNSHRQTFDLRPQGATWLITGSPWPVYQCK